MAVPKNEPSCNFFKFFFFCFYKVLDSVGAVPPFSAKRSAFIFNLSRRKSKRRSSHLVFCRVGGPEGVLWAYFEFPNM